VTGAAGSGPWTGDRLARALTPFEAEVEANDGHLTPMALSPKSEMCCAASSSMSAGKTSPSWWCAKSRLRWASMELLPRS
jgi:hypothetical protein